MEFSAPTVTFRAPGNFVHARRFDRERNFRISHRSSTQEVIAFSLLGFYWFFASRLLLMLTSRGKGNSRRFKSRDSPIGIFWRNPCQCKPIFTIVQLSKLLMPIKEFSAHNEMIFIRSSSTCCVIPYHFPPDSVENFLLIPNQGMIKMKRRRNISEKYQIILIDFNIFLGGEKAFSRISRFSSPARQSEEEKKETVFHFISLSFRCSLDLLSAKYNHCLNKNRRTKQRQGQTGFYLSFCPNVPWKSQSSTKLQREPFLNVSGCCRDYVIANVVK